MRVCKICEYEIKLWKRRTYTLLIASVLLLVSSLLPSQCRADIDPRLIIIGDSLSVTADSWPSHMDAPVISLMAQVGRTIRDYTPPRDLRPTHTDDVVVYFLGGNDIGMQSVYGGNPEPARVVLMDHLRFLTGRGFDVLMVMPPDFGFPHLAESNKRHRGMFAAVSMDGVRVVDINQVWDPDETLDGLHPNASLSYDVATVISRELSR